MAGWILRRAKGRAVLVIHAYAIEPDVVVSWTAPEKFRLICDKFGLGFPRVLLECDGFPKFADQVMAVVGAEFSMGNWKKLDELLILLHENTAKRKGATYDDTLTWLENAETEYTRSSYAAIIATSNPRSRHEIIKEEHVGQLNDPRWNKPNTATPQRTANGLASAVKELLKNSQEIHFVDPYFGHESRHQRVLKKMLRIVAAYGFASDKLLTVHCGENGTLEFFNDKGTELLAQLPIGITLQFKRWKEKTGGESLHNRYILTDIGGVTFGVGLDSGKQGQTDDVCLMSRAQYEMRWDQFVGANPAYELVDEPNSLVRN